MQKLKHLLVALSTTSLLFLSGCKSELWVEEPEATQLFVAEQLIESDTFRDAVNKAMEAATLTQTAKTANDWNVVADTWQQAIYLMKSVPTSSGNYQTAQRKATEYQANLEYAQRNSKRNSSMPALTATLQPSSTVSSGPLIAQRVTRLLRGMAYRDVVSLLGRKPDTVINDQIREEMGEPTQGHDLITFEWRNDDPDCQPVSIDFNPATMSATGWSEGRTCSEGSSLFNKPLGRACSETTLCDRR